MGIMEKNMEKKMETTIMGLYRVIILWTGLTGFDCEGLKLQTEYRQRLSTVLFFFNSKKKEKP